MRHAQQINIRHIASAPISLYSKFLFFSLSLSRLFYSLIYVALPSSFISSSPSLARGAKTLASLFFFCCVFFFLSTRSKGTLLYLAPTPSGRFINLASLNLFLRLVRCERAVAFNVLLRKRPVGINNKGTKKKGARNVCVCVRTIYYTLARALCNSTLH